MTAAAAENGGRSSTPARTARTSLDGFDEAAAQAALDALFGSFTVETVLGAVILPRRARRAVVDGDATVAQEHFASNLIRGRLLGIGRGWDSGEGRVRSSPVRRASSTTSG